MAHDRMEQTIRTAYLVPMTDDIDAPHLMDWGVALHLVGPPGSHKTSGAKGVCQELGDTFYPFSPGRVGEGAFGVVSVPGMDAQGRAYLSSPPRQWMLDAQRGLVFLDDDHLAAQGLTPAMMGAVLDRTLGDFRFPGGVRFMCASNPASSTPNGTPKDPAYANRLVHVQVEDPSLAAWCAYRKARGNKARSVDVPASALEATILADWIPANDWAQGALQRFLSTRPVEKHEGQLRAQPQDPSSDEASGAWMSPRSLEVCERIITTCRILKSPAGVLATLVCGAIGVAQGEKLLDAIARQELPDPAGILDGSIAWSPDTRRPDLTDAIAESVTQYVLDPKNPARREQCREGAWALVKRLSDGEARDCGASMAKALLVGACLYPPHMAAEMAQHFAWVGAQQASTKAPQKATR